MSPRAAARLEAIGFSRVYDYTAGKKGWLAAGLPVEGTGADQDRAGDIARKDPPTCSLEDMVGEVQGRPDVARHGFCVVIDEDRVVHGLLTRVELADEPLRAAEDAMRPAPATTRPNASLESALDRMDDAEVGRLLVTTAFGELRGFLLRSDAETRTST